MNPQQFQTVLTQTLSDRKLARTERQDLAKRIGDAALDDRQRGVYRHAAFDVARQALAAPANAADPRAAAANAGGWRDGGGRGETRMTKPE